MKKKPSKFLPEVRERAVCLVREQRGEHPSMWAAIESVLRETLMKLSRKSDTTAAIMYALNLGPARIPAVNEPPPCTR